MYGYHSYDRAVVRHQVTATFDLAGHAAEAEPEPSVDHCYEELIPRCRMQKHHQ